MKWISAVVACMLMILLPVGAMAVNMKSGNAIVYPKGEAVNDDILAAGNQVTVQPDVRGDVTAAGQSVQVSGATSDSVLLAGNSVSATGSIGNDAWIAGSSVVLDSAVRDNAYLAGSSVNFGSGARVGSDLLAAGNQVRVTGTVGRNLRVAANQLVISGTVNGDVFARADNIRILKSANIRGNLSYQSRNKATIESGATIGGRTTYRPLAKEKRAPGFLSMFMWWLIWLIAAILFGVLMLTLFPVRTQATADTVRRSPGASIGFGLLALLVVPLACVIAIITIIGIPLGLTALMIYLILLYAAKIFVGLTIGQWILGRSQSAQPKPLVSMILGLVILAIIGAIPVLGWLVSFVVVLLGLGAFLLSWWQAREVRRPAE